MSDHRSGPDGPMSVTVIVPNYNYGAYIREALASIAAQSHPPVQTIVYDDASSDDSVAVTENAFRELAGRLGETLLVVGNRNHGKLRGLNTVIPMATGTYTVILDADDKLHPAFLETLLPRLHSARGEDASIGFVYSDCELIDASGEVIAPGNSEPFDPEKLHDASYIPDCAPTLTTALEAVLPFDESIRVATKHHKWLRIVARGVCGIHIPQRLFSYRMHDTNMSGIGRRIFDDLGSEGRKERMLSHYWQSSSTGART